MSKNNNTAESSAQSNIPFGSENYFSIIFESTTDLIGIINEKGEVLEVNQSMETLFGYTKEEALKMTIKDFLFPYDTIKYPFDPSQIPEEKNLIINARFRKKDGSKVYAELNASRLPDGNYMGIIRDHTERKKEEAVLKTTVMLSNAVLESIHNGILVVAQNGTVIKYNDTFADMWRIPGEIMDSKDDKTLLEFILDQLADPNEFISKVKELYADPEAESFDEIHFKDGRIFERISKPMHVENKTYGRVWSFLDITQRRKAQDEYRTILATAIDGYYVVDLEGNLLDVNESYCKMIGYSRDELLAMNVKDLDAVETEDIIKDKIQYIMDAGPLSFETKHKRKDGKIVDIEANCNFLKDEKKRLFVFMKDVTQHNIAEEEIKKQKRIHEFIGKTNELILLAKTENDIYKEICRIAVETGNFVFAWLGIPDTKTKKIVPFVWAGHENGYLKNVNISTEDIPTGRGPCGIAYREARHYYSNDFENDPVMEPWRANAVARGYRSSISLPLMIENKVAGILTMYAAKPDFFCDGELELLINLTDNINYALNAISNDKRRKKTEDELRRSTIELRQLANHLTTIREEERSSIAKEIHDELSQNLVALNMNAAQLKSKIEDPLLQEIIDEQIEISNSVIKTSKTLFNSLHPSMLDELGLEAAIKWYAKARLKSTDIKFGFCTNVDIWNDHIPKEINLGFYRIFQETLTNILQHAQATSISVELDKINDNLSMQISDNGSGFEVNKVDTFQHHGILGIRERALAMGGECSIDSVIGKGTSLQVTVKI